MGAHATCRRYARCRGVLSPAVRCPPPRVLEIGAATGRRARCASPATRDGDRPEEAEDGASSARPLLIDATQYDAATSVVSLHHVEPLAESCARAGGALRARRRARHRHSTSAATTSARPPGGCTSALPRRLRRRPHAGEHPRRHARAHPRARRRHSPCGPTSRSASPSAAPTCTAGTSRRECARRGPLRLSLPTHP